MNNMLLKYLVQCTAIMASGFRFQAKRLSHSTAVESLQCWRCSKLGKAKQCQCEVETLHWPGNSCAAPGGQHGTACLTAEACGIRGPLWIELGDGGPRSAAPCRAHWRPHPFYQPCPNRSATPSIPIKRPGRPICQRTEGTTRKGCLALVFRVIASQNVANGRERLVL